MPQKPLHRSLVGGRDHRRLLGWARRRVSEEALDLDGCSDSGTERLDCRVWTLS